MSTSSEVCGAVHEEREEADGAGGACAAVESPADVDEGDRSAIRVAAGSDLAAAEPPETPAERDLGEARGEPAGDEDETHAAGAARAEGEEDGGEPAAAHLESEAATSTDIAARSDIETEGETESATQGKSDTKSDTPIDEEDEARERLEDLRRLGAQSRGELDSGGRNANGDDPVVLDAPPSIRLAIRESDPGPRAGHDAASRARRTAVAVGVIGSALGAATYLTAYRARVTATAPEAAAPESAPRVVEVAPVEILGERPSASEWSEWSERDEREAMLAGTSSLASGEDAERTRNDKARSAGATGDDARENEAEAASKERAKKKKRRGKDRDDRDDEAPELPNGAAANASGSEASVERSASPSESSVSKSLEQAIAESVHGTAGGRFDRSGASAALAPLVAAVGQCKASPDAAGRGGVAVTFAPNGQAVGVVIDGAHLTGTKTASCLQRLFRTARVPAFSGSPVVVRKTFRID